MPKDLTPDRIREMVGRLGDERILQIIDTGAIEAELLRAKALAVQENLLLGEEGEMRTEVLHKLYDILRADLVEHEEQ